MKRPKVGKVGRVAKPWPLDHRDPGGGDPSLSLQPTPGPSKPHQGREQLLVEMGHEGLMVRDLVHPALTDPLRNHQNSTFKLIKLSECAIVLSFGEYIQTKSKQIVFSQ